MPIKQLEESKYKVRVTMLIRGKKIEKTEIVHGLKGKAVYVEKLLLRSLKEQKEKATFDYDKYYWICAVGDYLKSAEDKMRGTSHYSRKTALEKHTEIWNKRPTSDISRQDVSDLIAKLECSDSTKEAILKYIRLVFEDAVLARRIPINPTKGLKINFDKGKVRKANSLCAMSKEEIQKLMEYFKETDMDWYTIIFVTYQLGIRFGEARELIFSDIDFNTGKVTISKSWDNRRKCTVPPKNGKSRVVMANTQTLDLIKKWKGVSDDPDEKVLPRINQWLKGGATKVINRAQDELGIRRTNYHSLRASFITHLLLAGVSVVKVQALVGHADLKTTMAYIRLCGSDLVGATDALEISETQRGDNIFEFESYRKNRKG